MKAVIVGAIRLYQRYVSSWTPPVCRYHPSCSAFTLQAVERHGAWRGVLYGTWRILRCQPFVPGGLDPVPPARP